ncbi:MAG TPA: hypothetical protein VJA26_17690 [Gammaproteobacteria bacterium]|nr:hypothetical protein [Gammaproteobacteria bacterium]
MRAALILLLPAVGFAISASPAHAESYYLIVGGLGGEPLYEEQFQNHTAALAAVARRTAGNEARVTVLTGEGASREALEKSLVSLSGKAKAADTLAVFLVGHGSFDGDAYKLNLPGPDIDGEELGRLLAAVPARSQLIVNATSASGAVLETWAADGRTVITATRSGFERNATRFAEHWAAALSSEAADINKNGVITAQEAFDYASRAVADSFESEGTLATEHPQLAGDTAARFNVARLQAQPVATPALERLNAQLQTIEGQLDELRARRAQMEPDAYLNELQELLVQLALVQRQIDDAQGAVQR